MAAVEKENADDGMEAIGFGCVHEEFKEIEEVKGLINTIPDIYNDQISVEVAQEKFLCKFKAL